MFPYLAPIKDWSVEVFKDREQHPIDTNLKMPWMILTSGAKVLKTDVATTSEKSAADYEALIKNNDSNIKQYFGCIIKNNTTPELNYQLNKTIVGHDFTGKAIEVEGETNRKISTPIIESVEINTDGANNTLKTAKINVRCFSLKQYEMFELFFCKPGMNLLFEWGNNILNRKTYSDSKDAFRPKAATDITSLLVPKNDYTIFKQNFSKYYRVNNETFKDYMINIEASRGTYDLVAGKVTDYSFSIDNGTYSVVIEISQGNQMTLAIPVNTAEPVTSGKGQNKNIKNPIDQWCSQISANLGLNYDTLKNLVSKEYENDFYNWQKVNKDKKDESTSKDAYISLRFILKILLNYVLYKDGSFHAPDFEFVLPTYIDKNGKSIECIPFRIHKNLISSSPDIIFPSLTLPKFTGDKDKVKMILDPKNREDGLINGYSIVDNTELGLKRGSGAIKINPKDSNIPDIENGNALNIFLNYKNVAQIWKKSYTRIDFLKSILDILNSNSYGLYRFQYMSQVTGGKATIVDIKSTGDADTGTHPYRFKVGGINSIARDFSFNFEMSNLVAGRTVFNAQKFLIESLKKVKPEDKKKIDLPPDAYKSFDNSMFGNADGFYSINVIDLEALKETFKEAVETQIQPPIDDTKPNESPNINEIIASKGIKFKESGKDKIKTLIFNDIDFITKLITSVDREKSTLTPIDINLTIDGLSGLNCGEYFNIDGIPEIYNKIGVFQITNTSHTISNDGWVTKIEAGFRINKK